VNSHRTARFHKAFAALPPQVQEQAREAYRFFKQDPQHPSLRFKLVHSTQRVYSVRINDDYRALGARDGQDIVWFWIGPHDEYIKMIARL
jgi:hypothetical protein